MNHNSPFNSLLRKYSIRSYEVANGLYEYKTLTSGDKRKIFDASLAVDLSDCAYFHYGDILFFIPLILVLSKYRNIDVLIDDKRSEFLKYLLKGYSRIHISECTKHTRLSYKTVITSSYKLLDYKNQDVERVVGLGNLREITFHKYPIFFADALLNRYLELNVMIKDINAEVLSWRQRVQDTFVNFCGENECKANGPVVFFAPFIASGKFRDFFGSKLRCLIKYVGVLSTELDADVVLIGGKGDMATRVDLNRIKDARGQELLDIMAFAASENVLCGVGFDNFWMHYFDLLGKDYYVKFRGRYSRKGKLLHFCSVNLSFQYDGDRLYI